MLLIFPGYPETSLDYSRWEGTYVFCSKRRNWVQGIFCANLYLTVGNFQPCPHLWCGECYTSHADLQFPVLNLALNLALKRSSEDQAKNDRLINDWKMVHLQSDAFLHARDGDHMVCPFECDLRIFHKLKFRDPIESNTADKTLLACIRRGNLDAFWSSAKSTIEGNTRNLKKTSKFSTTLGLGGPAITKRDHYQMETTVGMKSHIIF